jgi:hypothetical protein
MPGRTRGKERRREKGQGNTFSFGRRMKQQQMGVFVRPRGVLQNRANSQMTTDAVNAVALVE